MPTPLESMRINNIQPRQRAERQSSMYREDLEKLRLKNRREDYFNYEGTTEALHVVTPEAPFYCPEAHRFSTDFASEYQEERSRQLQHRKEIIERKRQEHLQREELFARLNQEALQSEEEKIKAMATRSQEHQLKVPYNLVTLQYDNSKDGQRMKVEDEMALQRYNQRATSLYSKSNSGYNIITGEAPVNNFKR
ncbi:hypothetical protein RCL1_007754 [Eukaryota sp. TZLM3-RCL]